MISKSATRSLMGFEGVPVDLLFSRNGEYLAAIGDVSGVLVREVGSGELVGELPTTGVVEDLELFGENRLLVSGSDIALWTFLREEEALELGYSVATSPVEQGGDSLPHRHAAAS